MSSCLPEEGRIVTAWHPSGMNVTGVVTHWRNHDMEGFVLSVQGSIRRAFYSDADWVYVEAEPKG